MSDIQNIINISRYYRKISWQVTVVRLILTAMVIAAIIILLPLKTLAHSLAAHYVRLREGYNYFYLQRDYAVI